MSASRADNPAQENAADAAVPSGASAPAATGGDGNAGDGDSATDHRPSAFALPTALALAGGVLVAIATDGPAPGVALREEWIYRLQAGFVAFALLYVLAIVLWLAWHGRTLSRIPLPGVGQVDVPADGDLSAAAADIDDFIESTETRLDRQEGALRRLANRVEELEDAGDRQRGRGNAR